MKTIITFTGTYAGEFVVALAAAIVRKIELVLIKRKQKKKHPISAELDDLNPDLD
jgi:citrate lyase synthetase